MTELKKLSSECKIDNLQDSLIKDLNVCGTSDNSLREMLLREYDLTLTKAISTGHAAKETRTHARGILISRLPSTLIRFLKETQ